MKTTFKTLFMATDIIIEIQDKIVLIERANEPLGWALPGGFVQYGESFESCAIREAFEETCIEIKLKEQFHTYSDPTRDPRHHVATTVFIATFIAGSPSASDDAKNIETFNKDNLPSLIVFDHRQILEDYFNYIDSLDKSNVFKRYLL